MIWARRAQTASPSHRPPQPTPTTHPLKVGSRNRFADPPFAATQVTTTTMMARILQLIHEIASKGIHVTKRDLFYTDVKLFQVRG